VICSSLLADEPGEVDPDVVAADLAPRPSRRTFTERYKSLIVAEYEAAPHGEKSAILRREGLYHCHIREWSAAWDAGALSGLADARTSARRPHLRSAGSPWGVVWQTARQALLSDILAAHWGTDARRAREHDAEEPADGERAQTGPLVGAHSDSTSLHAGHSAHAEKLGHPAGRRRASTPPAAAPRPRPPVARVPQRDPVRSCSRESGKRLARS
jgi:hypothetical protein